MTTDLLGRTLTPQEQALLGAYESLKALDEEDLAPCTATNVREALAALAVAVTELGLVYEQLLDHGC